jgi:hypothetical protein
MPDVSLVATLVGTVLGFVLGALWYGPLFGKTWMAAVGLSMDTMRRDFNPVKTYGVTFLMSLIGCYTLGWYLGPNPGRAFAVATAAVVGVCWVSTSLVTNYLFEGRSTTLMLINGGYHIVRFILFGLAFGLLG